MGRFSHQIRWNITRSVALASLFYFLYHAAKACLVPFITLYYRQLGLTATQTGIICGMKSFVWYISAPIWLIMAKRIQKPKVVLGTTLLIAIASYLAITVVPPVDKQLFLEPCRGGILTSSVDMVFKNVTSSVHEESYTFSYYNVSLNQPTAHVAAGQPVEVTDETAFNTSTTTTTTTTPRLSDKPKVFSSSILDVTRTTLAEKVLSTTPLTSTSSIQQLQSTTMSMHKMAAFLLNRVSQADPQDESDVARLIANYKETKAWPIWRQKLVVNKISAMLHVIDDDDDSTDQSADSDQPVSVIVPTAPVITRLSSVAHTLSVDEAIEQLVQFMMPKYLSLKKKYPSLTVSMYIENQSTSKTLSVRIKKQLKQALRNALREQFTKHQRRGKRSLSLEANSPEMITNSSLQKTTANLDSARTKSAQFLELLMEKIYLQFTNNMPTFLIIFIIVMAGEILASPVDLLSDLSFYELLDELDSLDKYGKHKVAALFGTLLAGISISVAVYFTPCIISGNITRYHLNFYAFAALAGFAFLVVPFYPVFSLHGNQQHRSYGISVCPSCSARVCSDSRTGMLLLTVFIVGITQAAVHDFLFWEVQDLPHSSFLVYGSYISVGAFTALLAIPLGRRLVAAFKPVFLIPLSLLCMAVQLLLYSFMTNAWFVVAIQALNIFGVPFMWTVVNRQNSLLMSWDETTSLLRKLDDVHVFAKASQKRALYHAYLCTYQGIAFALGSVISGVIYDAAGGSLALLLRTDAVLLIVWALLYSIQQFFCTKRSKFRKYSTLLDDSDDEDYIYDMNSEKANCALGFSKNKARYARKGKRKYGVGKKQRRFRKMEDLSSTSEEDDLLHHDWYEMNARQHASVIKN